MGWSQVVHDNRKKAELQRAREELKLRRRGYELEEKPCASLSAVLTLAGVLTASAWWRREGRKVQGKDWRSLPGVSHLLDFIQSGSTPKRGPTRSKAKPRQQLAPAGKSAAARQAAAAAASKASSSGGSRASAAAGAAAIARASGGASTSSSGAGRQEAAPVASTSASTSSSQQSKPKKKKNKKKK